MPPRQSAFASGVSLLVEAPANLRLVDATNTALNAGRIVVRVPPAAVGFAVDTPKARIVDLGTEFGVAVEPGRETVVQVFAGSVVAELKGPDASGGKSRRVTAGETVQIDISGSVELQRTAFSPTPSLPRAGMHALPQEETAVHITLPMGLTTCLLAVAGVAMAAAPAGPPTPASTSATRPAPPTASRPA